MTRDSAGLEFD